MATVSGNPSSAGRQNKQSLSIICAYLFVHSYLLSEILKLALTDFYKVLISINYKLGVEGAETLVGETAVQLRAVLAGR